MKDFFKGMKRDTLLTGAVCIVLGLVLLLWPGIALHLVGKLLGAIAVLFGAANILAYFRSDFMRPVFRFGLFYGAAFVLVGLFLFVRSGAVASIVPLVFGIVLLVSGISQLQSALDLRRMGDERWWLTFLPAAITLVLGLFLVFNPFGSAALLVRVIGACLIYEGVTNQLVARRVSRFARSVGKELDRMFGGRGPIETHFTDDKRD